ncbi:MAG: prephenate dehydrogenase/arogenate dehydrogenase family protein, partial [Nitriliruptoraceae bacterium]
VDDLGQIAIQADVVVVAVSPAATVDVWRYLASTATERTRPQRLIVIDVASTKAPLLDEFDSDRTRAAWATGQATFMITHPMAGRERSGWAAAIPDLYERAAWLVCPHAQATGDDLARVVALVTSMGARPVLFDVRRHDRFAALVSHLPHLIAFCYRDLLESIDPAGTWYRFSGGSLADMLRVADADPDLWSQILSANERELAWARQQLADRMAAGWQPADHQAVARPVTPMFVPGPPAGSEPRRGDVDDGDVEDVYDITIARAAPLGDQASDLAATGHDGFEVIALRGDDGDDEARIVISLGRAGQPTT